MFVRVNGNSGRPTLSSELSALSRERVLFSEFRYRHDTEIFGEAEPADFIYQIIEGAVRTYKLLSDGRRQIGAFHLPGDIFGLENGDVHRFTAEAIVDTTVQLLRRQGVEDVAEGDTSVTHNLLFLTTKNLQHAEDHMLLLGQRPLWKKLPPSCWKWTGGYLGLTLETVSRALSQLRNQGILVFSSARQIVLRNHQRLADMDA